MKDFIMREVTESNKNFKITRMRNSNGFASISIRTLNGREIVKLTNDEDGGYGADYENVAMELAKLIDKVACEPCLLPEIKE